MATSIQSNVSLNSFAESEEEFLLDLEEPSPVLLVFTSPDTIIEPPALEKALPLSLPCTKAVPVESALPLPFPEVTLPFLNNSSVCL